MFIHVTNGKYLRDYKIELLFNNGEKKIVNLEKELFGEVFEPLKDKNKFSNFTISQNTIEWSNGADFAPEFLYEMGVSR